MPSKAIICNFSALSSTTLHGRGAFSSNSSSPTLLPNSTKVPPEIDSIDSEPLSDVEICHVETLPTENSLQEALTSLETAVAERCRQYSHLNSGLLRLEVPLPRSINALHWLRGQNLEKESSDDGHGGGGGGAAAAAVEASLFPKILFSPRRSSAPDTEGSIAAGAASAGAGTVAGAGSAWLWKGQSGQPLDKKAMASMQRFLKTDHPRVRVFGGSRFDPKSHPAPEWEEFGSYCFVLPRIEVLELSGCSMIACTLAWDAASTPGNNKNMNSASTYNTLKTAATAAITALQSVQPPSLPHAPALRLTQLSRQHLPSENEWAARLDAVHAELVPATSSSSSTTDVTFGTTTDNYNGTNHGYSDIGNDSLENLSTTDTHPLQKLSPDVALEEYLRNGQQGLDELLAALDSGFEAILSTSGSSGEDSEDSDCGTATAAASSSSTAATTANNGASKKNTVPTSKNGSGKRHKGVNQGMNKIVLARRTDLHVEGHLDPLTLLEALQERDPRAYQIFFQLPSRTAFLASTPECLYTRSGSDVASEAVAGTRARGSGGDVEKDFWLAFDLLRSQKDDVEFGVVRDWVRRALGTVCDDVRVEITKSVLKQGSVQHLYGKLAGRLKEDIGDAGLLAALHPTPAVCGQPRGDALKMLSEVETFDRGFYSGPFGWISRDAAEFVVAIRSALVRPRASSSSCFSSSSSSATKNPSSVTNSIDDIGSYPGTAPLSAYDVALFAGVGIVCGSDTASEWAELNLKISQFERLLKPAPSFSSAPNISALWARVMVEELCRRGCNTFCVAPGSRSSPLTVAIASHPRAKIVPCIDERSLGFWALGYGRARGLPAVVVTSSGTAVANLLPAVVEASQSHVPMLLLTADRPFELRETGANQTIDQVNIFGSYTRWDCDLEAPLQSTPAMRAVEKVGEAVRAACATHAVPAGPVHLNCQFREPLAPKEEEFESFHCLKGINDWEKSQMPFETLSLSNAFSDNGSKSLTGANGSLFKSTDEMAVLLSTAGKARRGLLIIGELIQPQDVAAIVQLAQLLGWPIAADVLSGIKVGAQPLHGAPLKLISHFDHLLLDSTHWKALKPDVVLQVGGHITSKRVAQFLEWCCCQEASSTAGTPTATTAWLFVSRAPLRQDQGPNVSVRVKASVPELLSAFRQQEDLLHQALASTGSTEQTTYCQLLQTLDTEASLAIDYALSEFAELTEPAVARVLSQELPPGEGLFIGNSMPIRDLDMYGMPAVREMSVATSMITTNSNQWSPQGVVQAGVGAPVAANRGASGIDGVLSTAAGFADGLQRGTTLVVGDISFLHDVNGLNLLRSGDMRPPLTVVLVNNGGGGIFSFLPIAHHIPDELFTPLWATPQNVDLAGMCRAHGIPHIKVASPEELRTALRSAWGLNRHSVIEAITDREANVIRHREIQAAVQEALNSSFARASTLAAVPSSSSSVSGGGGGSIIGACCSRYELPLQRPVTTTDAAMSRQVIYIILDVKSNDNNGSTTTTSKVAGEVAPLPGLHKETLEQAHCQAQLICELLSSALTASTATESPTLSLPESAELFEDWLKRTLAIDAKDLFPSVRFGLEGALLSAMAAARGIPLDEILISSQLAQPSSSKERHSFKLSSTVLVNAMIDPQGNSELARAMALSVLQTQKQHGPSSLGNDDQCCVKIKVGRTANPLDDAAVVKAVYDVFSGDVKIRLDANRAWSLEQALQFGHALNSKQNNSDANNSSTSGSVVVSLVAQVIEYIEEPLQNPTAENLSEFYRKTRIHTALDESVDERLFGLDNLFPLSKGTSENILNKSSNGVEIGATKTETTAITLPEGVTTLVLKPSTLGGFLPTLKLAQHARKLSSLSRVKGVDCVISSAFELPLGISQLAHLAAAVDSLYSSYEEGSKAAKEQQYHGLGTGEWWDLQGQPKDIADKITSELLGQKISLENLCDVATSESPAVLNIKNKASTLNNSNSNNNNRSDVSIETLIVDVATDAGNYSSHFLETRPSQFSTSTTTTTTTAPTIVFLHGFLGQPAEWIPFMKAFSSEGPYRCLALSLPGHGSIVSPKHVVNGNNSAKDDAYSIESTAAAIEIALDTLGVTNCIVVGYSLGARIALLLSTYGENNSRHVNSNDKSNSINSNVTISRVVSISGSPGMPENDVTQREQRVMEDAMRAVKLREEGLDAFMSSWYTAPMWDTLTKENSEVFNRIVQSRKRGLHENLDLSSLSLTLEKMSPGRAPDVQPDLYRLSSQGKLPKMVLVAGEQDKKFVGISKKLVEDLNSGEHSVEIVEAVVVEKCGHTVHVEQPVVLLNILFDFITSH
ncbi:putative Protein PHYLLO, chloroplastic [Nannochloris sp. 'desiccata']|nr:hypothetical protein KSW81_004699 [Chlorella desiccata (nom. nud.)]KAH7618343.1 putative Protein PHYLLO, chloroplastic [Chlorella desiccata (nom. nud.)]